MSKFRLDVPEWWGDGIFGQGPREQWQVGSGHGMVSILGACHVAVLIKKGRNHGVLGL